MRTAPSGSRVVVRRRGLGLRPLAEERREVAADDLDGRPPERVGIGDGGQARRASRLVPEVSRRLAGQEHAAEHRPERLRRDVRTGVGGDRLGGRIGLLRRDPALLEGNVVMSPAAKTEPRPSTRPHMSTGTKPPAVCGTPSIRSPRRRGSATAIDLEDRPSGRTRRPRSVISPAKTRVWREIPRRSRRSRTAALAAGPKISSGSSSGVTIESSWEHRAPAGASPSSAPARTAAATRRRPTARRRRSFAPRRARRLRGAPDPRRVGGAAERERAGNGPHRAGADRDQEDVVRDRRPGLGARPRLGRPRCRELFERERSAGGCGELGQIEEQ